MTALNDDPAVRQGLLETSDEGIEAAVALADPTVLRALLYQLTGDEEVRAIEVTKVGEGLAEVYAPSAEDAALLRRKTVAFLRRYRDEGAGPIEIGPAERLPTSLALALGVELDEAQVGLYTEELGLDPWVRSLKWQREPDPARLSDFKVLVIGAAMGGLNAALQLKRAGIPFQVIEKNPDVGGTWYENRYPGIRVDVPSRGYTHVFGADFEFPYAFCPGPENKRYFDWVADEFGLREEIEFETEVRSMRWREESSTWEVEVSGPAGDRTLEVNAIITAVGFLNRPNIPEIEGMADFKGPSWHTARWPEDFDHRGKRIAVIGTGATGYQMIPELAREAEQVVVFQRTPQWLMGTPGYLTPLPPEATWLDRNLPLYPNFVRFLCSAFHEAFGAITQIDPDYEDPDAVNERNARQREACIAFLEQKLGDPDLVAKMTPPHPFGSGRPLAVDTEYSILDAIQLDNVVLETGGIRRIDETGIVAADGTHYEVDAIVYATGFKATEYLFPMTVTGRDGVTIEELWAEDGARAYRGCMMPGFPNLWTIYGPNTNAGLQAVTFHEMITVFALECIGNLILDDDAAVEVSEGAYRSYNELVDERNRRKVWSDPRAHNYYWTEYGRSATMCPFFPAEMWSFLRHPDYADLETTPSQIKII